jgi:ribose 5-phosphate isomerase RpiB
MRLAVINETSAADRNADILAALAGRGHEVLNVGMTKSFSAPEITYIHTGLMSALLLHAGRVELVIGGCGTGQGYMLSAMQYPGVVCGHIVTPLDAWLFPQINGGNCLSLMLNQGYGWGSDINLRFLFDRFFEPERGGGYPPHRRESQATSRQILGDINRLSHRPVAEIVAQLPDAVLLPALSFPGFAALLDINTLTDRALADVLAQHLDGGATP